MYITIMNRLIKQTGDISKRKLFIIQRFQSNIKGKKYKPSIISKHCGAEGHWLETNMGIAPNADNKPDLLGFEQKKNSNKITWGDWSASAYLFSKQKKRDKVHMTTPAMKRGDFIRTFGTPNPKKDGRFSWSGKCFPKYGEHWNNCGQRLLFDASDNLRIEYSFKEDQRDYKGGFPDFIKNQPIVIAFWERSKLEDHVNNKFNQNGFYLLKKNEEGIYTNICFGPPIQFDTFKAHLKSGAAILDSGIYEGNARNYSSFRSGNSSWKELVTEEY